MSQPDNPSNRAAPLYAVLTGDIVASKKLSGRQGFNLQDLLDAGSDLLAQLYPNAVPLPLDVFRWDSWQLLVSQPWLCLRIALVLRCYWRANAPLQEFDTRISFGIGTVEVYPESRISRGDGQAFRESGRLLDDLPGNQHMSFSCPHCRANGMESSLDAVVYLVDNLVGGWTRAQSRAVFGALQGQRQSRIAASWQPEPITQQAVSQHLQSACFHLVEKALHTFEVVLQQNLPAVEGNM